MKWEKHKPHGKSISEQVGLLAEWIQKNYVGLQIDQNFYNKASDHGKRVYLSHIEKGRIETKKASVTCFHNAETFNETGMVVSIVAYKNQHESRTINLRQICNDLNEPYYQDAHVRQLTPEEIQAAKIRQHELEKQNLLAQKLELEQAEKNRFVAKLFAQIEVNRALPQSSIDYFNNRYNSRMPSLDEHNYLQSKQFSSNGLKVINPFGLKLETIESYIEDNFKVQQSGASLGKYTPKLTGIDWSQYDTQSGRKTLASEIHQFQEGLSPYFRSAQKQPIVLPMQNVHGEIVNIQTITRAELDEHGDKFKNKFYLKNALRSGAFLILGELDTQHPEKVNRLIVCEGWATGKSIQAAVDGKVPVLPALDIEGIKSAVPELLGKFPNARIAIAIDNDHDKHLKELPSARINAGLKGAIETIDALPEQQKGRVSIVCPRWVHNDPAHLGKSDFNDLAQIHNNLSDHQSLQQFKEIVVQEFKAINDRKKMGLDETIYWTAYYQQQQHDYTHGRADMPSFMPAHLGQLDNAQQRINDAQLHLKDSGITLVQVATSTVGLTTQSLPPIEIRPIIAPVNPEQTSKPIIVAATPTRRDESILERLSNLQNTFSPEQLRSTQTLNIGGKPENVVVPLTENTKISHNEQVIPSNTLGTTPLKIDILDKIGQIESLYTPEQLRITQRLNIGGLPENKLDVVEVAQPKIEIMDARLFTQGLLRYQRQQLVAQDVFNDLGDAEQTKPEFFGAAVKDSLTSNPEHQLVMDAVNPKTRDVMLEKLKEHADKHPDNPHIPNVYRIMNDLVLAHLATDHKVIGINTKHIAASLAGNQDRETIVQAVSSAVEHLDQQNMGRSANDAYLMQLQSSFSAIDQTQNWSKIIEQAKFVGATLDKAQQFNKPETASEIKRVTTPDMTDVSII